LKRRYPILFVLSMILISSLFLTTWSGTAFCEIEVEQVRITRSNGRNVYFSVYQPVSTSYGAPLPAIITIHGISGSRGAMSAINVEFARRNFTVISVDLAGHGVSSERFSFATFSEIAYDVYEAVRYVQENDIRTSNSTYGVIGHSLGAGIALSLQAMPIQPSATILIGGGMGQDFGGSEPSLNSTNPRNLMLASGVWDEVVPPSLAYDTLREATGLSEVNTDIVYGAFSNGTARKLFLSPTNHLFEITDSAIITNSLDWMIRSLQGGEHIPHTLSLPAHIYQVSTVLGLINTGALLASLFPLYLMSYSFIPPNYIPRRKIVDAPRDIRSSLRVSLLISITSSIFLILETLLGFIFDFSGLTIIPVSFGMTFLLFSITMYGIVKYLMKRTKKTAYDDLFDDMSMSDWVHNLIRAFIISIPIIIWLFFWSIISTILTGAPMGFTPQSLSDVSIIRGFYIGIMTVALIPMFYVEFDWWAKTVGMTSVWTGLRSFIIDLGKLATFRLGGILIILSILYIPFLFGFQFGFIMFIALLLLPISVFLLVGSALTMWIGRITKNPLSSAFIGALLIAIVVVSTFQLL